jgi:hypothetical protein
MKCGNCKGTHDSAVEVKVCYFYSPKPDKEEIQSERQPTTMKRSPLPAHLRPDTNISSAKDWSVPTYRGDHVMDGTYAVMLSNDPKDQVTLRFHVLTMGPMKGKQAVDYLKGPDNENDWQRFANAVDGGYRVHNRFLTAERMVNALVFMMKADRETLMVAGEGYAKRANRCWRCFRSLTKEVSITRGMGPVCAEKMGVA